MAYVIIDHATAEGWRVELGTVQSLMKDPGVTVQFHLGIAVLPGMFDVIPMDMTPFAAHCLMAARDAFQPGTVSVLANIIAGGCCGDCGELDAGGFYHCVRCPQQ